MSSYKTKQFPCVFQSCTSTFNRPYKLAQHLLVHNNIKAFVCHYENCSKSYYSKSHLDRHINNVHNKPPEIEVIYSCPMCMRRYSNRQNLKRHINIHHTLKVPFSCDICKMEFNKKNQLSAHMYQHTGIKSFSCEHCCKQFVTFFEKRRHLRYHKLYCCEHCDMQFNHWSGYLHHKKTSHIVKEYICNDCGMVYQKRVHMVRHVKNHDPMYLPKVFPCPYDNCKRSYSRNSNLKQHFLIKHTGFSFVCEICEARLSSKAKLKYHLEKVHKLIPEITTPKPRTTQRKERKDKGTLKTSTAIKLAGIPENLHNNWENLDTPVNSIEITIYDPALIKK